MNYAVIDFSGRQYKVEPNKELIVDKLDLDENKKLTIDKVLLIKDGKKVIVGQPTIEKAKITAKVLSHFKGDKIRVAKFRPKTRYRKVKGFRPHLTKIKVEKIIFKE